MSSTERDHSDERSERSAFSKLPMWDSSDPDRNPPPLPMNPQASPATVRAGASASIVQAAMMFTEKPRESSISSQYTTNPLPDRSPERSPERSLIKGAAHRRLQSVRDIRNVLDGRTTPERSPERLCPSILPPPTSPETPSRCETPSRRPSSRPNKMFGENTPPSATMLALQTMTVRDFPDPPLSNITNGSTKPPQTVDTLMSQIASLTSIASNLQREMAHLTRRSKDNASDLNSLKEATNSRDEDIRKSLKDLVKTINKNQIQEPQATGGASSVESRSVHDFAGLSTPPPVRAFTLPRISSPGALFEEGIGSRIGSPNPYSVEGAASVAMLEKIIREMVTKEGQERLLGQLNELFEKTSQENGTTAKNVADLVQFIRQGPASRALVYNNSPATQSKESGMFSSNSTSSVLTIGSRDLRASTPTPLGSDPSYSKGSEFVNDDVVNLLKKIKDSVFHSGAVMNEVKAQQRDLRHEVITIGRNLAQKIDDARRPATNAKAIEDGTGKQDIARIVTEGLSDLKAHLDTVMREKRRESSSSTISRATVDTREIYDVVKHTISTRGLEVDQTGDAAVTMNLDKEAIVDAIKEAYEAYQPNINVQQFGLERDEILDCLKEGLESHSTVSDSTSLNRVQIIEAIQEAMTNFTPPAPINDVHEIREEVLSAFRECLDEIRPSLAVQPVQARSREIEALPEMIADAVRSGLRSDGPLAAQTLEINSDDLLDAVTRALEESKNPLGNFGEEIRVSLANIILDLHEQFKQYSAAHGRDTEQVLDAMRDGQELLRADVEAYVDRAQDVTGKDEIIGEVRQGVSHLLKELEESIAIGAQGDSQFKMTIMHNEFEKLNNAIARLENSEHHRSVLDALHLGFEEIRTSPGSRGINSISDENFFGEAVRGELEQVRDTIIMRSEGHKDEILDSVKIGFEILESKLSHGSLQDVRSELEHLRSTLAGTMGQSGASFESRELMEDIHLGLSDLKARLLGEGDPSSTLFSIIHSEFQTLRASINSGTVSRSLEEEDQGVVMESLRDTLEAIREASGSSSNEMAAEALQKVSVELSKIASAVNNSRDNAKADSEDLSHTIRCAIDDLRGELLKRLDNPEGQNKAYGEIIDAINETGESFKTTLAETVSKPIDLTVCYDILETLKNGIAAIKVDVSALKDIQPTGLQSRSLTTASNQIILAEGEADSSRAVAPESLKRDDLQQLEVTLASLQVKVEALSDCITDMPSHNSSCVSGATKEDIDPLENMLKDMQATLDLIASGETGDSTAKKEDTDAIETLLRNIKSHLEENSSQISTPGVSSDQMAELSEKFENIIGGLSDELKEDAAKKEDVDVLQQLLLDMKPMIDDLKSNHESQLEHQSNGFNTSIDALRLIALEVKEKVLELHQRGLDTMPHKDDLIQITGLIHTFRDSHDKFKESYEADIGITARAFDDRKKESENLVEAVQSLRELIEGVQIDMSAKLNTTGHDVVMLVSNIHSIEETIKQNFAINEVVREIREKLERDFERVVGTIEALKSEQDSQTASVDAKHDQARVAIVEEVAQRVAEHSDMVLARFEEARVGSLVATNDQREILESNRATAADLQVSVDTLGMAVTGLKEDCEQLTGKVTESSEVVFTRINNGFAALEGAETRAAAEGDHHRTREEVVKVLSAVNALQNDVFDNHPRFMVTLEEIHGLVSQQLEQAKKTYEESAERERARDETSRSISDEIKTSFSTLPALLPAPVPVPEAIEKFDDAAIHSKLDNLLTVMAEAKEPNVQLQRLDKIQEQVAATAAELTSFVASQTRLITDGQESKEKEIQESLISLERHRAEKEHLESDIRSLAMEKDQLRAFVEELRAERDLLVSQKAKYAADVSALQTALHIRKEELHAMDNKADALERRILEGIMDQSRAILYARGVKDPGANIRVPRAASNVSSSTIGSLPPSHPAVNGLSMAMKTRSAAAARRAQQQQAAAANTGRRILSLSQITGNTPTGAQAHRPLPAIPGSNHNLAMPNSIMKRSQSVRSPGARKVSWNTRNVERVEKRRASHALENTMLHEDEDKENSGQLHDIRDEDEEDFQDEEHSFVDDGASTGTVTVHDIDGESVSDGSRRDSAGSAGTGSYVTGSYMTGSDISRRASNISESVYSRRTSEVSGTIREDESEGEENYSVHDFAHEQSDAGTMSEVGAGAEGSIAGDLEELDMLGSLIEKKVVLYGHDIDSGLGSDAPTAGFEREGDNGYFRRAAEDDVSSLGGS